MRLFDLHADTASRLFYENLTFSDPALQLSADDLTVWDSITQVFACFSSPHLTDEEAFAAFRGMRATLLSELWRGADRRLTPIIAVEDARILAGKPDRLPLLAAADVRILTLLWRGVTCIGGAYDTKEGLSSFGRETVKQCFSLDILPDVSHASVASFYDVAALSAVHGLPLLATHSNSYSVCPHLRNLTDTQFKDIVASDGLVGLSLYPPHLSVRPTAAVADILRHIERWLSLGGEDHIALGTDLDGIDSTPDGIKRGRDLRHLAEEMKRIGYPVSFIQKLFYKNADAFFGKYMKRQVVP